MSAPAPIRKQLLQPMQLSLLVRQMRRLQRSAPRVMP
jgi:hypothetical protein